MPLEKQFLKRNLKKQRAVFEGPILLRNLKIVVNISSVYFFVKLSSCFKEPLNGCVKMILINVV
jgi:hypothetical protein